MLKKIESDIFKWINSKYKEATLSKQIEALDIVKREYTGHGFFIDFVIPKTVPPLNIVIFSKRIINGPCIRSKSIEHNGGSILFIENYYIKTLELYANGNKFAENINDYELY